MAENEGVRKEANLWRRGERESERRRRRRERDRMREGEPE